VRTPLAGEVTAGRADLAIGPRPSRWDRHVGVLGREEIVVAMARTDPLAAEAEGVTFALIAGEPVVHYHPDNGLGDWLDDVAAPAWPAA
jgi:DNA-binding transcriptional LysR family regulator